MVVPPERRVTRQTTRKAASHMGFDALARNTLLRALRMRCGHSTRRASRIRANASETRLMGNVEIGSYNLRRCLQLCCVLVPLVAAADATVDDADPYVFILGIAQDAGYPQASCYRPHCMRAWKDPALRRLTSSIAVVDGAHGNKFVFDATPDIREQLYRLHVEAPNDSHALGGIFLTHGHIGHYTGLMHFGREAVGASGIPVFAMPRMQSFLRDNGPWSQLVKLRNIELIPIVAGTAFTLSDNLSVMPLQVPHRDEYTETVGYRIDGPNKSALFVPDIDKWSKWEIDVRDLVREVDYALLDGSFFSEGELPGRDMNEIPHPTVQESIERFADLSNDDKSKIIFIHFNHTNPLLIDGSDAQNQLTSLGFRFATEGMRLPL